MKRKQSKPKLKIYANLADARRNKKDAKARKRAEYLASLPKNPVKRFFYRLHPKRVFSKKGLLTLAKIFGVLILIGLISIAGVYMYFRKDLDKINPADLSRRVKTTVNKYYDRHGTLLWEDKGSGDYRLVIDGEEINKYVKQATIAIEDRDFYNHRGVSLQGITRALVNNLTGGSMQGGSTLTQQLVKQVFFADEAHERGIGGIGRKIKEAILSIEVERMYSKEEIITLYLNESSYGGRRNGVESAAQTYFGKSSKDLTLAEAALVAAIPNSPARYNPYNIEGHEALKARQRKVLDDMVECGFIDKKAADEAKKVDLLNNLKPEVSTLENIKAPHFVLEAQKQLENQLGMKTVRAGGLEIITTLDLQAQQFAESAVQEGAKLAYLTRSDNLALSSVDVETGQVIAMVGSIDFNRGGYGQTNAAVSPLEPGSSIKPLADYVPLFKQRQGVNYGPGSILRDDDSIRPIYCGNVPRSVCDIQNFTRGTYGNVTIRKSLGSSLNRPAVKAMHIAGVDESLAVNRALGNLSYCQGNNQAGLSAAIGGGCTVKQVEHTNAYATLARGGSYRPLAYVLDVKNSSGDQLYSWGNEKPKQVVDPQVAYMITDILADPNARSLTFGLQARSFGFMVPGVWTASKTGTTDNGRGQAKDSWMMGYSSKIATGVWSGNHDGSPMSSSANDIVRRVMNEYMRDVHTQVYQAQGKWKPGEKIEQPAGMKRERGDIWPSWYDQKQGINREKMIFDKVSKKRATDCTPAGAKEEVEVSKMKDPITEKDIFMAPDGYDASAEDDVHNCSDVAPSVSQVSYQKQSGGNYQIQISLASGTHPISRVVVTVAGQAVYEGAPSSAGGLTLTHKFASSQQSVSVTVRDEWYYEGSGSFSGPVLSGSDDEDESDSHADSRYRPPLRPRRVGLVSL